MAARITKADFEARVIQAKKPVLVDFYSDSCIPCKQLSPVLGDLEDEREETLQIYKVNVGYEAELVEEYHIMSSPTLVLFKDGKEAARRSGFVKKEELTQWIESN